MKLQKLFLAIFLILILLPCTAFAEYWASKKSNKFHNPSCTWAQKINPGNKIVFKNKEEALGAGYIPCKVCKP